MATLIRRRIDTTLALVDERNRIITTFGLHIPPPVVERLLQEDPGGGTEMRRLTILFLDIRGFTSASEKKSPDEVVRYLNQLFDFMVDSVNRHSGIINKFLGDGFMAVFGAPFPDERADLNAVNAAKEILAELATRNQRSQIPPTQVGMGIHSGMAVVGTIGSSQRKEYTVIGDTVNLASRVEGMNKEFQSALLVTEEVYRKVADIHAGEELPAVKVKGREQAVRLFKLA